MAGATAKDIAKKLGISTASVSVALNGKPGVSAATRQRILAAAAELGYYAPKITAADSRQFCFLIYIDPEVGIVKASTYYTFVLQSVERAAKELGCRVLIRYYYANRSFTEQMSDILQDIDGLLVLGTDMTGAQQSELGGMIVNGSLPFPVVVIDNFILSAYADCVGNDNLYGTKAAVSYLIDQGRRTFAYVRANQRVANFEDRENGIRLAIAEHLGGDAAPLMVIPVDISPDRTFQDICSWLEQCPALPEAIIAENDEVAAAAIRALRFRGCAVPEEVAVMGFDDIPICEMVDPAISTVHTHKEQLGSEAVSLLYRRIVAGETAQSIRSHGCIKLALSTRIVARGSTAPLERR